jgi:IS30 family transposase
MQTFVLDRLAERWRPEQISGWLRGGNERRLRAVARETIYAFIYRAAQKAMQLWRYLTRRHKRRRRADRDLRGIRSRTASGATLYPRKPPSVDEISCGIEA